MLALNDVGVSYGKVQALKRVSLKVQEGKIVAVLGANGAGKTTLLSAIMGLAAVQTGSIHFDGEDISRRPTHERVSRGIVLVPEGRKLFPEFSVLENLSMGAYQRNERGEVQRDLEQICAMFPILEKRQKQRAKTLSGGEAQMLAIGRALMARPRMLLLDEPSMGLMPVVLNEIFSIVRGFPERGVTVLVVEQNAKKALEVSHEGAVLELGRILLKGASSDLRQDPRVKEAYLGG